MSFVLIICSTLLTAILGFLRFRYSYWEIEGVPQLKTHFIFGNLFSLKSKAHTEILAEIYEKFKTKSKLAGFYLFLKPQAVILDLDLVQTILIKDFNKFIDRMAYNNETQDPISAHLFNLSGEKWRSMRQKLTPTFTASKMKYMFPTIIKVAKEFEAVFEREVNKTSSGIIEMHDMFSRFTTDVIGNCIFGIECNSLQDPNVEFRKIGNKLFSDKSRRSFRLQLFLSAYVNVAKYFGHKYYNDFTPFFMHLVRETIEKREIEHIKRNDLMQLLIELKNEKTENGVENVGLTIEQIAAQAFIFFFAGYETSSSNMSYALYELAKNVKIQEKLRKEILSVLEKHDGVLSYETISEMCYLEQVMLETLRKYPPLAALTRIANEDYLIPDTNITLEKGTKIYIPIKAIHNDPQIYDNPHEFRPERFSAEAKEKRYAQAFLGFGDGPRNCIGLRFARMQVRIGLITLLKSFKFTLPEDGTEEEPIATKLNLVLYPANGVRLCVTRK